MLNQVKETQLCNFDFDLRIWKLEVYNAYKENRNPSLFRALFQLFGAKYIIHGLVQFFNEILLK